MENNLSYRHHNYSSILEDLAYRIDYEDCQYKVERFHLNT